jgi:hypothetical protein
VRLAPVPGIGKSFSCLFDQLLEPDFIRPSQYFPSPRIDYELKGLDIAILYEALQDVIAPKGKDRARRLREATQWLSGDDPTYLLSFVRICERLQLDPVSVRTSVDALASDGKICQIRPRHGNTWRKIAKKRERRAR